MNHILIKAILEKIMNLSEDQEILVNDLIEAYGKEYSEKRLNKLLDEIDIATDTVKFMEIKCTYYGEPKAQPRARFSSKLNGFFDNSGCLRQFIIDQVIGKLPKGFKPYSDIIEFKVKFYLQTPKSFSKKDTILAELGIIRPIKKPDIDNLDKLLYDALTKILYTDDACIVTSNTAKYYSCKPRAEIEIRFKV